MLNYVDQNSTCMNLLKKNGINISDKNSLKAAASMSAAKADLLNNMLSYQGCVLPSEALSTFGTDSTCTIANNYNLIHTKPGVLSVDTDIQSLQLQNGEATYPLNGCLYNINSRTNPASFIKDAGNVLDQENKAEIARLTQILNQLKSDCGILDQNIATTRTLLSETQTKLANQQALCRGYVQGINTTNQNIGIIKNTLAVNTANAENLKAKNNRIIQDARNMVVKCNRDIRHCFITEDCPNGGQGIFSTVRNLGSSRGRVQKINGYIPDLNIYQFDKKASSLIIPPGIEVRVFDDVNYSGGNTDFIVNINENDINKIDRVCLVNEKYSQNIIRTDNLGNITVDNTQTDWNDKIRSIRVRRAQEYTFEPTGVIEAYTNYEDKVVNPLIYKDVPGNIDPYFYNPVEASIVRSSSKDYLSAYTKKDAKKIGNGVIKNSMSFDPNNPDLKKLKLSATELSTSVPLQNCAKACDDDGNNCSAFTFDPSKTSCDLFKSQPNPYILMDKPSIITYIKSGTAIQDNMALPDGPYKQTSDLNTGIYDGKILQIDSKQNAKNSKMNITECKPGTIINPGELKCTPIYSDGLNYKIYEGYFADNLSFFTSDKVISSGTGVLNGANLSKLINDQAIPDGQFSIEWTGKFKAKTTGSYQFWLNSDDGSYLWIGDSVANATTANALVKSPPESTGKINLEAEKYYDIRIVYGQINGPLHMILSFKPPGAARIYSGINYFYTDNPIPIIKPISLYIWEHPWKNGYNAKFILPAGKDSITFNHDDKDLNGRDIDWRWVIRESSSMLINAKPDECEVTLIDKNGEKIMLRQNTEWLMDFGYLKGGWHDRARQLIIKRL